MDGPRTRVAPELELPDRAKHRGATANKARAVMRVRVFTARGYDLPPKRECIGPSVGFQRNATSG